VLAASQVVGLPVAPPAYPAEAYPDIAPNYNYRFGVDDTAYSGAVFSHEENRADYNTQGEYRVNLPDGRVQIVTYTAGPEGYVADVKYEGEAVYPEEPAYKPAPYHPAPAPYKPAPVVKVAAPTYKPAPVVKVAAPTYAPVAPVVPVVKVPAPAPYHPAPAVYKPVVKVAPVAYKPVVKPVVYKPKPAVYHPTVFHAAPGYHAAPAPKYTPKKYGYSVVTTAAPEAEVKEVAVEEVVEEEVAEVAEVAAPAEPEASSYEAPATEAAPAERYRYYRH
jgi:hypothetical protein